MAASLNRMQAIGNLGADPELRYTTSGASVCEMRVAVNESWTDKQGQRQESTEWLRVIAWGKLGENCAKYLAKGRPVYLEGRLKTRSWDDKEGNKRQTTEIVATDVQFLQGGSQQPSQPQGGGGPAYEPEPVQDDIPFLSLDDPTPTPGRRAV